MIYVALNNTRPKRRLTFYLAMEEYVAKTIDEEDCFFMWQVQPSVIFGRNQLVENIADSTTYRHIVAKAEEAVSMPT